MFYRVLTTLLVACGLILVLGGCGQNDNVTAPLTTPELQNSVQDASQHICWGMYDVAIDANTGEIETVPLRTADFNANVVMFLQPPAAPIELVVIMLNGPESELGNGLITMDITLRHPFPGKTIFRGFDVRGIIMAEGSCTGIYDPELHYPAATDTTMLNPDGFTRWWNQVEFTTFGTILGYTEGHYAKAGFESTSTLNPFKLHTPSLEPAQPVYQMDLNERATFPAVDGAFTRKYRIQFDASTFPIYKFKYAVDASWSLPDPAFAPDYPIEAYDEHANCQEPYYVKVEQFDEIPYYVDEWVSGGDLEFLLTIGDWQATGGDVLPEISHVWLESPSLFESEIDVRDTMEFVESLEETQATYRIRIEDMLPDGLDGQQLVITVESANPDSFEPQIQGDTSPFAYPSAPLAAYCLIEVPITNLAPQGNYAYVYFLPDWCATMRSQCANGSGNQLLMEHIMTQNIEGYYNDFTHVQVWEGKTNTSNQTMEAFAATCSNLGYSLERTYNDTFDASGSRVVISIALNTWDQPPDPPFTQEEATAMQEFIENGGILFFMCEASGYFNDEGYDELFGWLGMLMDYGGGAEPEYTDGYTNNITWHWLTEDVEMYHYFTCGTWLTMDPHVLTLVATETDQNLVLMYPLPLE